MKNEINFCPPPLAGDFILKSTTLVLSEADNRLVGLRFLIPKSNRKINLFLKTLIMIIFPVVLSAQCDINAGFTTSGGGCSPVTFSPTNNAGGSTHQWIFNGAPFSTSASPSYTFPLSLSGITITHIYTVGGVSYTCTQYVASSCINAPCNSTLGIRIAMIDCEYEFDFTEAATGIGWQFGDGGTASVDPATHTYTSGGVYTVTLTYTIGGVTDDCSFDLYAVCECDSSFISEIDYDSCVGLTVAFEAECADSVYTHYWDFDDGCTISGPGGQPVDADTDPNCVTFGTYDNPIHVYNVNTYTSTNTSVDVIHTVFSIGTSTATTNLNLAAALPGAGIYVGYDGLNSNLSDKITNGIVPPMPGGGSNFINNLVFYVFGSLSVDLDYDIRNSAIHMGSGAALNIVGSANHTLLALNNTDVDASCECLWRWVSVEDDCKLKINNGSLVRDALFAVYPLEDNLGGASIKLQDSDFRNNFIGLFADEGDFNLVDFNTNTFEMVPSTTLLHSCGLAEAEEIDERDIFTGADNFVEEDMGFAGMLTVGLADVDLPQNNSGFADVNLFRNMSNGIVLRNSSAANISYCRFEDILNTTTYLEDGIGILFTSDIGGMELRQEGISNVTGNTANVPTFDNCLVGVLAITSGAGTDVKSFDNRMEDGLFGYFLRASGAGTYTGTRIHDNEINNYVRGVVVNNSLATNLSELEIYDVTIDNVENGTSGIEMTSDGTLENQARIYNNIINTNRSDYGILLNNWDQDATPTHATVENNIITIVENGTDLVHGINHINSDNCIISCNYVTGTYTTGDGASEADGIFVQTSDNCEFIRNEITDTRRGLSFSGNCLAPDNIELNQFLGDMDYGLYYESGAMTDVQEDMENDWSGGSFDSDGAIHLDSDPGNIVASVYLMPPPDYPTWDPILVPWFQPGDTSTSEFECPTPPEMMMMFQEGFSEMEILIANDEFSMEGSYAEGLTRQLKATLYRKIQNTDPELLEENFETFSAAHANTPVGQLYTVESGIANLVKELTIPYEEELTGLQANIDEIRVNLNYLDSLISEDTEGLQEEKAVLLQELEAELEALNEIHAAIHEQSISGFLELLEYNEQITTEGTVDENEIQINRMLIQKKMNPEAVWSEEEWSIIESLAYACPLTDGKKVYIARMWYYEETGIQPQSDCEAEMRGSEATGPENKATTLKVNPNPAQDIIYVDFAIPEGAQPNIVIQDIVGNTISTFSVPVEMAAQLPISCGRLQSGVYFILLQDKDRTLASHKIIIIH